MIDGEGEPIDIVEKHGLKQVTDTAAIEAIVQQVIDANPEQVAAVKDKPKTMGWFVGQVMKASGGKANPQAVNQILRARLGL
jgi:aspartyl-tRNA(Asn)/glutamyl-tRNA(Gln) amidotransferase subunit B